jgi:hypothetical protein
MSCHFKAEYNSTQLLACILYYGLDDDLMSKLNVF